jgi:hypothetical protein
VKMRSATVRPELVVKVSSCGTAGSAKRGKRLTQAGGKFGECKAVGEGCQGSTSRRTAQGQSTIVLPSNAGGEFRQLGRCTAK